MDVNILVYLFSCKTGSVNFCMAASSPFQARNEVADCGDNGGKPRLEDGGCKCSRVELPSFCLELLPRPTRKAAALPMKQSCCPIRQHIALLVDNSWCTGARNNYI